MHTPCAVERLLTVGLCEISPRHTTPNTQHQACLLGSDLLRQTFKFHADLREELLDQILCRVVTKCTTSMEPFLNLLSQIVSDSPVLLTASAQTQKLRDAFDYISQLDLNIATGLMSALQPVISMTSSLRDSLMVVLRKALFSRDVQARRVAVAGFLMLLAKLKIRSSSSQRSSQDSGSTEAFAMEILGTLRRCTTQQAVVRQQLYAGLSTVACQHDGELCEAVLEVLEPQFNELYVDNEERPPFRIDDLVTAITTGESYKAVVIEPIGHLLHCMSKIVSELHRQENPAAGSSSIPSLLQTTARRLGGCDLEDLSLDKSTEYNTDDADGVTNIARARLMFGVFEVLLAHIFNTRANSHDSGMVEVGTTILNLFKKHESLSAIVGLSEKKSKPAEGAAGRPRGRPAKGTGSTAAEKLLTKQMQCSINLPTIAELFRVLLSLEKFDHVAGLKLLKNEPRFVRFVLRTAIASLNKAPADKVGMATAAGLSSDSSTFECCKKIAVAAVIECARDDAESPIHRGADKPAEGKKAKKGESITLLLLEAFQAAVAVICRNCPDQLMGLLTEAGKHVQIKPSEDEDDADEAEEPSE